MSTEYEHLESLYKDKTTDELLFTHGRGTLTDFAYSILEKELISRGVKIPERPPEPTLAETPTPAWFIAIALYIVLFLVNFLWVVIIKQVLGSAVIIGWLRTLVSWGSGWLIFYAITKQTNPFKKPQEITKRPKWFLALYFGLVAGAVFLTPLHGVGDDLVEHFAVKTGLLILYMVPGFIGFFIYKTSINIKSKK
ncbi:hypothetical protein FJY94_05605 [Candidatus Kaiserbacteria bacterium]|nr:hypothetical protein [Candidatus Kaiserbacteria bacterium]